MATVKAEAEWWQRNTGSVPKAVKARLAAETAAKAEDQDGEQVEGAEPVLVIEDEIQDFTGE